MSVAEIRQLPLREKFQILEALWADLSDRVESIPLSPAEESLLDSRLQRIESGQTQIHEWDEVKDSIGKK